MDRPDFEAMRALLDKIEAFSDNMDAREEHSVLQIDPATGSKTIIGPFPNREVAQEAIYLLEIQWAAVHEPPMAQFEAILSHVPAAAVLAQATSNAGEGKP